MENIQVKATRWKTLLLLFAAFGFVVAGIWMLLYPEMGMFNRGVGLVGVIFFGAAIPIGIKKLIINQVELELSEVNLIIKPESNNTIPLPWSEIKGFDILKIKGTKIIIIKVLNPKDYIDRETNPIRKALMKFNNSNYGSPFNFTGSGMNISTNKLLIELNRFHTLNRDN